MIRPVQGPSGTYSLVTGRPDQDTRYEEIVGGGAISYSYRAPATSGTITVTRVDSRIGRATGSVTMTLQGARGTRQFQGGFDARATQ